MQFRRFSLGIGLVFLLSSSTVNATEWVKSSAVWIHPTVFSRVLSYPIIQLCASQYFKSGIPELAVRSCSIGDHPTQHGKTKRSVLCQGQGFSSSNSKRKVKRANVCVREQKFLGSEVCQYSTKSASSETILDLLNYGDDESLVRVKEFLTDYLVRMFLRDYKVYQFESAKKFIQPPVESFVNKYARTNISEFEISEKFEELVSKIYQKNRNGLRIKRNKQEWKQGRYDRKLNLIQGTYDQEEDYIQEINDQEDTGFMIAGEDQNGCDKLIMDRSIIRIPIEECADSSISNVESFEQIDSDLGVESISSDSEIEGTQEN